MNRKEIYNQFAKHYNSDQGLSVFSELETIQHGFEKRVDGLRRKMRKKYDLLENKLENVCSNNKSEACRKAKDDISKKLERETKLGFHIQSPERMQKELLNKATDFFNQYCDESKASLNIKMFSGTLNLFLLHSQELQNRGDHLSAIRAVTGKIIDESYPEKLPKYDELPESEQKELTKVGRKLDETAPQNEIERKVSDLIEKGTAISKKDGKKKEFIRGKDNVPKPTTIRDFIVDNDPEIQGEISDRRLFDRVKLAIKKMK